METMCESMTGLNHTHAIVRHIMTASKTENPAQPGLTPPQTHCEETLNELETMSKKPVAHLHRSGVGPSSLFLCISGS